MPSALTIEQIDAALTRAMQVPLDDRTSVWHSLVDGLLEQRLRAELEEFDASGRTRHARA